MQFAGGASRRVTVHIDPDDLRHAYVTAKGSSKVIKVNLSMTVFADLTLEEAIELIEEASKRNPKQQEIHDEHLKEVRARRARESGFFPDTRDPSNYQTLNDLRRRADRLAQVSSPPPGAVGPTARPGRLTDRSGATPAFKVGQKTDESDTSSPQNDPTSRPAGRTFSPIKDSKL